MKSYSSSNTLEIMIRMHKNVLMNLQTLEMITMHKLLICGLTNVQKRTDGLTNTRNDYNDA